MQKTKLESEIERAKNGQNSTKQRVADCPLQYLRRYTVQKSETELCGNSSVLGLKNHCYSAPRTVRA
jgi:oligoribonuclease (3'-5' exoribonuclease)